MHEPEVVIMAEQSFATYPSLADRGVLITGGASGIGASMVEHFAAQGAHVGFIDLDSAAAERLLAGLRNCRFAAADLRDVGALRAAIDRLRGELGLPFTVLVNNAARDDRHTIESVTPEYWDERVAVNLRHQFFAAQALREEMIAAGGGSIVNMSSISFVKAQGGMPVYLTAKSGVIGLTRALARDLGPHRIRVNSVLPGWIMTERQLKLWVTPEAEAEMLRGQCIPDRLYPPDIARMVLWLAADDSRLVTSQSFTVDAGWT
jgi:D-xylose 1-dehydrogenase